MIVQMDDDASLVLAPKQKIAPEEEPVESIPFKAVPAGSIRGTPSQAKSSIAKRKLGVDDIESANGAGTKKMNFETVCNILLDSFTSKFPCTVSFNYVSTFYSAKSLVFESY